MICSCCKDDKEIEDFYPYTKPKGGVGRRSICKSCDKKRARKFLDRQDETYARNNQLKVHYGIDLLEYNRMFAEQGGCCAICNVHQQSLTKRLAVDHCHDTLKVRKLLCSKCNMAIGLLNHDTVLLQSALAYIQESQLNGTMYGV